MYFTTQESIMNSSVAHTVSVVSSTKDSIYVRWNVEEDFEAHVQGYEIRYTAIGSTVIQHIPKIKAFDTSYDIQHLHENTYYDICVKMFTNFTSYPIDPSCVQATTATDSLSVALGSTFGAFLALGVIVFFVFLAKWNHNRKLKRQLAQMTPSGESFESIEKAEGEGDIEMSDVSLQVQDETGKLEIGSQSSSTTVANGVQPGAAANHIPDDPGEAGRNRPIASTSSGSSQENKQETTAESALLLPTAATSPTSQPSTSKPERPPDVRPKTTKHNQPLVDLTHAYQNKPHRSSDRSSHDRPHRDGGDRSRRESGRRTSVRKEETAPPIRPNQSCNW